MKHEAKGVHRIMWHFSPIDYTELDQIWNGPHPEDGMELEWNFIGPRQRRLISINLRCTFIR